MKSLGRKHLSDTRLKTNPKGPQDLDIPMPMSVKDIAPNAEKRTYVELEGLKSEEEIKNANFWNEILKMDK